MADRYGSGNRLVGGSNGGRWNGRGSGSGSGGSGGNDDGDGDGDGDGDEEAAAIALARVMAESEALYKEEEAQRQRLAAEAEAAQQQQRAAAVKEQQHALFGLMFKGMSADEREQHIARNMQVMEKQKAAASAPVEPEPELVHGSEGHGDDGGGSGGAVAAALRAPERETSNPTDLHHLQDHAYRESLAADMVKSRHIYVPDFDTWHEALADRLDEMVHLLDMEQKQFPEATWLRWGFRRVDEGDVVGFELADVSMWEVARDAATQAYQRKVRHERLKRFSPSPTKSTRAAVDGACGEGDGSLPSYNDFLLLAGGGAVPAVAEPMPVPVVDPAELQRLAAAAVPDEPSAADPTATVTIQFRGMLGGRVRRVFFAERDTVIDLINFAHGHGYPPATHDVLVPTPRHVFDEPTWRLTLREAGLGRREIIQVEKR
jgi:hypothetical protein